MKTCVITGNGPSILEMPADTVKKYDTFGVNYCPYIPTYYVCVDHDLLINHHDKVYNVAASAKTAYLAEKEKGSSRLYNLPNVKTVTHDVDAFLGEHYFSGMTVVYVALKLAFYMGYERVHLFGVDHSPEWGHYKDNYPRGDTVNRIARMQEMEYHYRLAQIVYTVNNRRIINHSLPSKLDLIFPRK